MTRRYPFTLSKTSLTAVGSPTTYPAILAALGWLVELLIYDAAACEADPQLGHGGPSITAGPGGLLADGLDIETLLSSTTGGPGDSGFFFNAVTESYNHFLAGEDDACEVIDGKVAQAFELKHKGIEGELERMRQQNEAMKQELAAMRSEKSPLPSLTSQQSLLKQEIDQETRRVKDLEHQRDALNAGLLQHSKILKDKGEGIDRGVHTFSRGLTWKGRKKEHGAWVAGAGLSGAHCCSSCSSCFFFPPLAAERTVESLHSSLSEISKAIAGQELSQQDVDRLASRKSALREEHASLQQSLYEAKQLADNAEVALKRALNELSARLSEYHSSASKLQLLPSSAKYAFGLDYGLKVNEAYLREVGASASYNVTTTMMGALDSSSSLDHDGNTTSTNNFASATTTSLLLGNDVKTSIKPNLRELKAKMIRQANDQSKQGIELADAIHSLNEAIAESQRTAESLSRSIRAKEDALASAKQEHEAALQQQQGITDSLTQQLSKTRQELSQVQGTLGQVKDDAVTSASLKLRTYTQVLNDTRMRARLKFQDCLEVLARHKDTVVEKLEALRAKVQSKRDAELAAPPPRETLGGRGSSSSSSSSSSSAAVMAAIAANKAARMQSVAASTIASSTSSSLVGRLAPPTPFDDTAPPAPVTTTAAGARQPLMAAPSTSSNNSNNPVIAAIGRATIGGGAASSKPFVAPPTVPHPQVSAAAVAPPTVLATATTNRHLRFEEM